MGRSSIAAVVAVLCMGGAIAQAKFVAAPGSPYSGGNEPYSINAGLFNGDPRLDLAVVNGSSSDVSIFLQQPANGGFAQAAGSPYSTGTGPNFAGSADFNGDGRQDLAVANFGSSSVRVLLQQANGTFASEGDLSVSQAGAAVAGDLNGDGRPDIVASRYGAGSLAVFLRKPDNTGFQAPQTVGAGINPRHIAIGDLDGANGPDLVVSNDQDDTLSVLLNGGGGSFGLAPGTPLAGGDTPHTAVIADLNGDGRGDIASTAYVDHDVYVYLRQANGTFAAAPGSPYDVGGAAEGIAAADLRAIGRKDLVVAVAGTHSVAILRNDGGTFAHSEDIPLPAGDAAYGLAVGPFNDNDAVPDIAVSSVTAAGSDPLDVFFNFQPPRATTTDASGVTGTGATLNATVNPMGSDTDAHFEYGTTTAYGSLAPAGGELAAGSDGGDHIVSRQISDLALNTTYHYRVVTSNTGGTSRGEDKTFTTLAAPPASRLDGPPQAFLSAPSQIAAGTPTTLSAEGSTPAGGLTYEFDLDGSGQFATKLATGRNLPATFPTAGDVKVGLRVTDAAGRTDEVRRTVHVTAPTLYNLKVSPSAPRPGQRVTFKMREVTTSPAKEAGQLVSLTKGSLATATFGDGRTPSSVAGGLLIRGRAASASGTLTHTFDRSGSYRVHLSVDDLFGAEQGVDLLLRIAKRPGGYQPAISTPVTTVDQGSCVRFANSTGDQLMVNHVGPIQTIDDNPLRHLVIVAPSITDIAFGGDPTFGGQILSPTTIVGTLGSSKVLAGNPIAHLAYADLSQLNLSFRSSGGRRTQPRQAEPSITFNGATECARLNEVTHAAAVTAANFNKPPFPKGADVNWPAVPKCPDAPPTTYSTENLGANGLTKQTRTTRHTFFSINQWDFGDGTKSGPEAYLPTEPVYHPFDKGGKFLVKLKTTFPRDLDHQFANYVSSCTSNPLDAKKPDGRFDAGTAEVSMRVKAHYDRIRSKGLWLTSGAGHFTETDYNNVYESTGPIYINTRRAAPLDVLDALHRDEANDQSQANGVLVVTPENGPLQLVADTGEIIGRAHLSFQSNRQQFALGDMPLNIRGTPGMIIPNGTNKLHDFGFFNDPPASVTTQPPPNPPSSGRGKPFHVNSAHVVLREANGGSIELNVHMPPPLGPDGQGSDETITRDVKSNGLAVRHGGFQLRGILDNFEIDVPPVEIIPGKVSFKGGKLSHHTGASIPWLVEGKLDVFGKTVDMTGESATRACPVHGGLGFFEDGGLAKAGAVIKGLQIPIPNPPAPNPITALSDPALQIVPGTSTHPFDLFGCLSISDYPEHKAFKVTGCAGFLFPDDGVDVPKGENIPFCPDQNGNGSYVLTDNNSRLLPNGRRHMQGVIVRVSGDVGLGPDAYNVANAYIEFRDSPFAIEFAGHFGQRFEALGGHLDIGADLSGHFYDVDDWAISGSGGVTQDILCLPNPFGDDVCPGAAVAAIVSSRGIGGCVTISLLSVGGVVRFAGPEVHIIWPGCDEGDLKKQLGFRALPRADDLLAGRDNPFAVASQVKSAKVSLDGGVPYALMVINGAGSSPVVQVRDPQGKLVLDDNGQPVQGGPKPNPSVPEGQGKPVDYKPVAPTQGIVHNSTQYHDGNLDLRNATLVKIRSPKKGAYTVSTKDGSAAITAITSVNGLTQPKLSAGVVKKGAKRMLTLQSKVPAGTTIQIAEESKGVARKIATLKSAKATSATARVSRASRHIPFKPALGPGGKRQIVATLIRADGTPVHRMVIGSYRAPAPPKAGTVRKLRAKAKGSKLTITWKKARNARRYVVRIGLRKGVSITRSLGAKGRRLVLREPLVRQGATVTVHAVGPLSDAGKSAKKRVKAQRVKKPKRFVL